MKTGTFPGKVGIQQRVLPHYRIPFFGRLSDLLPGRFEVFAGFPASGENISTNSMEEVPFWSKTRNLHFLKGHLYLCWQRHLTAWLRQFSPEVLVCEANPRLLSNYPGIRWMKSRNLPVIGWGLGVLNWDLPGPLFFARRNLLSRFFSQFDALIAYSNKAKEDFMELGFSAERVFVAPNSVSSVDSELLSQRIKENPNLLLEWQANFGLSDKFKILFVGRLLAQKRVEDLIEACSGLVGSCELLIVGDGTERERLEIFARERCLDVRFLGHKTGEDLACCFGAADLFVLPGLGGLAVQEAMIYGKPVIVATGDGTQGDLVEEGRNGFHITPGDIPALREKIEHCMANSAYLERMGQESQRIIEGKQNIGSMAEGFLEAFNFVID